MSNIPTSPYLSRSLISACRDHACGKELIILVAFLSSESPYLTPRQESLKIEAEHIHKTYSHFSGDHLALLRLYHAYLASGRSGSWCRDKFLRARTLKNVDSVVSQLEEIARRVGLPLESCILAPTSASLTEQFYDRQSRDQTYSREDSPFHNYRRNRDNGRPIEDEYESLVDFDHLRILKALCSGFFVNTARRHPQRPHFYHYLGASGTGSGVTASLPSSLAKSGSSSSLDEDTSNALLSLYIHPSSCLSDSLAPDSHAPSRHSRKSGHRSKRGPPDWVVYQDLQFVNRANMRVVSRIEFEWVESGLKRVAGCPVESVVGLKKENILKRRRSSGAGDKGKGASSGVGDNLGTMELKMKVDGAVSPEMAAELKRKDELVKEKEKLDRIEAAKTRYLARKK
jgi:hypothetical protein